MRRPASVTVIAVLLILGSVVGIASPLLAALHPAINAEASQRVGQISRLPVGVLMAVSFVVALINLVSAILMLRGRVFGRTIYTVIGAMVLVELVVTTRALLAPFMVLAVVEYAVFVFLLFRPAASTWLRSSRV